MVKHGNFQSNRESKPVFRGKHAGFSGGKQVVIFNFRRRFVNFCEFVHIKSPAQWKTIKTAKNTPGF